VELRKNGRSTAEILDHLNETYAPPPAVSNKKHSKWSRAMVERLFHTRALIGIKEISVDGVNYELKDYYPRVIDDAT
ncbi:recombinase family protein, partial [Escherichia coli]|nr:recombinase family protein [Escherichia coli]